MSSKRVMAVIRGTRESVIDFYEEFEKFEVRFIAGSRKPYRYHSEKTNFQFINTGFFKPIIFDPASIFTHYGNLSWIYFKELERYLEGVDVVNITDTYYFINYQAVNWAMKNNVPVVTIIWCTIPNHITTWLPPYSYITKKVIEATELFILRSRTALNFTDSINIPRSKVKVIYKGVDLRVFKPQKRQSESGKVNLLFVGNLTKAKGLDDLIEIFLRLYKKYNDIELTVAGSGEMENTVIKLGRQYPINFKGFVEYEKLPELYRNADVFCIPSKERKLLGLSLTGEYFPYVAMEALASGLPIVASRIGGLPEAIGGDNFIVSPGDLRALEKAIEGLVKDKSFRQSLGAKNRKRAEVKFNIKLQAEKTEDAILSIL